MVVLLKAIQRRCYTFLNTTWGFILFVLLNYVLIISFVRFLQSQDPCRYSTVDRLSSFPRTLLVPWHHSSNLFLSFTVQIEREWWYAL